MILRKVCGRWAALAICWSVGCATLRVAADTIIDANSFTFHTPVPANEAPANDFHFDIKGNFVGDPSSDVFPNRSFTNTNTANGPTGTADFSGGSVNNDAAANVKFKATGSAASPTGYFTKDKQPVGFPLTVKSKALDGTEVAFVPRSGGFDATLTLFNNYGSQLSGVVEVLVNSGFKEHFNLEEFDTARDARLLLGVPGFTLAPRQGITNVTGFLASSDDYLLIRGVVDSGDGAGPSPFSIAISPVDTVTTVAVQNGYTAIANNFNNGANELNQILPAVADQTALFKFNSTGQSFDEYAVYHQGTGWVPNGSLNPGEGVFVRSLVPQNLTFSGQMGQTVPRARPVQGLYFVSCPVPYACDFVGLLGFPPTVGDQVWKFAGSLHELPPAPASIYTFGTNGWNVAPVVYSGESVMVQLVSEPKINPPITSTGTLGDFAPADDAVFNTDTGTFQIGSNSYTGGRLVNVPTPEGIWSVPVFDFQNINVPTGITVRATGASPLVLLAQRNATVNGTIDVSGAKGSAAGILGGPGGGGGGGVVALFSSTLGIGTAGRILAQGGDAGASLSGFDCLAGGPGGAGGPAGAAGGDGGASVAGGKGGAGGAATFITVFGARIYLGSGGGGGGGGAYAGPGGAGGAGTLIGTAGTAGNAGACPAGVNGGPGGDGGGAVAIGGPVPIRFGVGGAAGAAPGGAGGVGNAGAPLAGVGGGGGGGGGATIGGPGGPGGPGAGLGGGGGGGGGADTCVGPGVPPAIPGGGGGPGGAVPPGGGWPGGSGGGGSTNLISPSATGVIFRSTNSLWSVTNTLWNGTNFLWNETNTLWTTTNYGWGRVKEGGAGGGGSIRLASWLAPVQNAGILSVVGGAGASQQGGTGTVVILGRLETTGQVRGVLQETYGQTSDPWLSTGGAGGGGAGGNGQANIPLTFSLDHGALLLIWEGVGVLQSADQIDGPWSLMPTATSPFTVQTSSPSRFYRVALPCE